MTLSKPPRSFARRNLLIGGVATSLGAAAVGVSISTRAKAQYRAQPTLAADNKGLNILMIVTDQERAWDLLPQNLKIPARQRLAERGMLFNNMHVITPICSESRGGIYTGQHAQLNGVWENVPLPYATDMRSECPTLGSMLGDAGYHTAYFGKWHLTDLGHNEILTTDIIGNVFSKHGFTESHQDREYGGTLSGHLDDAHIAGLAVDFLRKPRADKKPWFATVNLVNPHDIMFFATGEHQEKTRILDFPDALAREPNAPHYQLDSNPQRPQNFGVKSRVGKPECVQEYARVLDMAYGQIPFDDEQAWSRFISYYHRCIEDVDRQIARVLDALERSGQADRTIVVYTSDHGEMLGTHGLREKGLAPYREIVRVPFVVRHPDIKQGGQTSMMSSTLDLAPSLLSMAGVDSAQIAEKYPMLKGRSFTAAMGNRSQTGPRDETGEGVLMQWNSLIYLSAQSGAKFKEVRSAEGLIDKFIKVQELDMGGVMKKRGLMRGVSDGRYKFARYFSPEKYHTPNDMNELVKHNDLELYDLKADPGELKNLANNIKDAKVLEVIERMNGKLNRLMAREVGKDNGDYIPSAVDFAIGAWRKHRNRRQRARAISPTQSSGITK
jgi:arylsulfatase A-like enzyme